MSDLTRATGQPVKITVGDKELILSPITVGDLAEFEAECKQNRLKRFLEATKMAEMDKEERLEGMARILTIPFTNEDFVNEMSSTTGVRYLLWRSIVHKQPKFTLAQIDELSDLDELMNAVSAISNLGRVVENPPEAGEESPSE